MSFPSGLLFSSCWRCRIFSIIAHNFPQLFPPKSFHHPCQRQKKFKEKLYNIFSLLTGLCSFQPKNCHSCVSKGTMTCCSSFVLTGDKLLSFMIFWSFLFSRIVQLFPTLPPACKTFTQTFGGEDEGVWVFYPPVSLNKFVTSPEYSCILEYS